MYMHLLGLIHMDIKPDNIMSVGALENDRRWKVGDFGHTLGKKVFSSFCIFGDKQSNLFA